MREGETGLLVPPADPAALAAALERVRHGLHFSEEAIADMHERCSWSGFVRVLEEVAPESAVSRR